MFETIRQDMRNLGNKTFHEHFVEYVMRVQDSNIDRELSYMLSHNVVTVDLIDRAITNSIERFKEI